MDTLKILHIESNPHEAMLTQAMLASATDSGEYDVVHVDNLRDALWKMKQQGYNAVLLDLKGADALDGLRSIRRENPSVPVVVISGMQDEETALKALGAGAQECVLKETSDGKVIRFALQSSLRRKEAEDARGKVSHYDDLTGLPTGLLFSEHLNMEIERASRWQRSLAVMFVDVYGQEHIHKTHGRDAANKAMLEVSLRLKRTLRNTDLDARYHDDQFLVLLDDHSKYLERACKTTAGKVQSALEMPYTYRDGAMELSASISVAILRNGQWLYQPSTTSRYIPACTSLHPVLDGTVKTAFQA